MAGEIQADYHTSGVTLYSQVRSATGTIWNTVGVAFEAYATANIADYDIAMVEQGTASKFWAGTMPSVTAGIYSIVTKLRAGGAPAETDLTIAAGDVEWDGSNVVSRISRASQASLDVVDDFLDTEVAAIKAKTDLLPSVTVTAIGNDVITAAAIANGAIDSDALADSAVTEIQTGLSTLTTAQVNAEMVDVLTVDTFAEVGQETPAATNTLAKMIRYLFKAWRNKKTQTATDFKLFADDAMTVDQKASVSDDGTTTTIGAIGTVP